MEESKNKKCAYDDENMEEKIKKIMNDNENDDEKIEDNFFEYLERVKKEKK